MGEFGEIRTVGEIPEHRSGSVASPRYREDRIRFSEVSEKVRTDKTEKYRQTEGRYNLPVNQKMSRTRGRDMGKWGRNDSFEGQNTDSGGSEDVSTALEGVSAPKSLKSDTVGVHTYDPEIRSGSSTSGEKRQTGSSFEGFRMDVKTTGRSGRREGGSKHNQLLNKSRNQKTQRKEKADTNNAVASKFRSSIKRAAVSPIRSAAGTIKEAAEKTAGSGQDSGMNTYDMARDTFAEKRRMSDRLQELLRMVVKVVKVIASTTILPLAALLALIALIVASVVSFFTGSNAQSGTLIPNPTTERQVIYNGLLEEFEGNRIATIGVMCALMAESGCHANATEGASKWGLTAEEYTEKVNDKSVTKEEFINSTYDGVQGPRGYGIAQWSTTDRKKGLYDYALRWAARKGTDLDIASIDMQVAHLRETISGSYASLKEELLTENDMETACYKWIATYERPSQKNSTWEEKAKRNIKAYADDIQKECTVDLDRGNILWPVPSVAIGKISSPFGYRGDIGIPGATKYHNGIDIGAASGSDIVAVAPGTVKTVTYSSARGNYVIIDHGEGKETLYQHMRDRAIVNVGDVISAGMVVGYVGSTGVSGDPHLHFEVHIGGSPVDPLQYYK